MRDAPTASSIPAAASLVAASLAGAVLAGTVLAGTVYATPTIGRHDIATLFYIAKSDDRNRVDYGASLDSTCAPQGSEPLYSYWRRFEPGQPPLGDLNVLDATGYGIEHQAVRVREASGSWIEFGIRALPARRLLAVVQRAGDRCVGSVQLAIGGHEAVLDHVFVQLDGPMRVREVVLHGRDRTSGASVTEVLRR